MFDTATTHYKYLKGSCHNVQEVPSYTNRLVGFFCKWLNSVCLATYGDTLSPIEIDIGRKVVSCSHIFRTQLIFLFCNTIMPSPPSWEVFHWPVRIPSHKRSRDSKDDNHAIEHNFHQTKVLIQYGSASTT